MSREQCLLTARALMNPLGLENDAVLHSVDRNDWPKGCVVDTNIAKVFWNRTKSTGGHGDGGLLVPCASGVGENRMARAGTECAIPVKRYPEPMAHGSEACEPSNPLWPMARRPVSCHTRAEAVLSSVPSGWGVWPPLVVLAGGLVAVGCLRAPPRHPPLFFFSGGACLFLPLPSLGWRTHWPAFSVVFRAAVGGCVLFCRVPAPWV